MLFAHTPKAAGVHLIEYFEKQLGYRRVFSDNQTDDGLWIDYPLEELLEQIDLEHAFVHTHVLAFGWSALVEIIPFADKQEIISAIRTFRSQGWFTFTFVRYPGELLTSFYFYVLDAHERGWDKEVARHVPVLGRSLYEFVSEHCDKQLLPDYWREFDYVDEASDSNLSTFFADHFGHQFMPKVAQAHASGSRGYAHYCETGEISRETQERIESSRNMAIFQEIVEAREGGTA